MRQTKEMSLLKYQRQPVAELMVSCSNCSIDLFPASKCVVLECVTLFSSCATSKTDGWSLTFILRLLAQLFLQQSHSQKKELFHFRREIQALTLTSWPLRTRSVLWMALLSQMLFYKCFKNMDFLKEFCFKNWEPACHIQWKWESCASLINFNLSSSWKTAGIPF